MTQKDLFSFQSRKHWDELQRDNCPPRKQRCVNLNMFEPKGNDEFSYFLGTFDRQGHTISNVRIISMILYAGLFSSSSGVMIKNVVADSFCSFISSCVTDSGYDEEIMVGSISELLQP